MAQQQQSSEGGAPEWMVSYADMITIIMAFFVVLYASTSASGTKETGGKSGKQAKSSAAAAPDTPKPPGTAEEEERLQRVFESLYARFGPEWTISNCWRGGTASRGREGQTRESSKPSLGRGRESLVVLVAPKPNENVVAGGRVYFADQSVTLDEEQQKQLRRVAEDLAGKMQKLEIRGHTDRRPIPPGSPYRDHWDLAYARARAVEEFLVAAGIDRRRIRIGVAGENEPFEVEGDPLKIRQNSRVEIHLLNEWVVEPGSSNIGRPRPKAEKPAAVPQAGASK